VIGAGGLIGAAPDPVAGGGGGGGLSAVLADVGGAAGPGFSGSAWLPLPRVAGLATEAPAFAAPDVEFDDGRALALTRRVAGRAGRRAAARVRLRPEPSPAPPPEPVGSGDAEPLAD
jgi:hypothetical protein